MQHAVAMGSLARTIDAVQNDTPTGASALACPVLVLNRNYQAINIITVRKALVMMVAGSVEALDGEYQSYKMVDWLAQRPQNDDDIIATPSRRVRAPRLVICTTFGKILSLKVRFTRNNIFRRDNYVCQYCRRRYLSHELNIDHVFPRSRGGEHQWENVVTSCLPCNTRKRDRTPDEACMPLLKEPKRPAWPMGGELMKARRRYPEWEPFLPRIGITGV